MLRRRYLKTCHQVCLHACFIRSLDRQLIRSCSSTGLPLPRNEWPPPNPIIIVGGGPVGLCMGIFLKQLLAPDQKVILLDKKTTTTSHPQAHYLNLRTMEIFLSTMPHVHDRIQALATPIDEWKYFEYATSLLNSTEHNGKTKEDHHVIARVDQIGDQVQSIAKISPTFPAHCPQHMVEEILEHQAKGLGLEVRRGQCVSDISETLDNHNVSVVTCDSGECFESSLVIGADGAQSFVRSMQNEVRMVGPENLATLGNVHFTSKRLSDAMARRPAMLYFVFHPEVIGVLICHHAETHEWVLQIPILPPIVEADLTPSRCLELIQLVVGEPLVDIDICSIRRWTMHARVATAFVQQAHNKGAESCLVGDAAHEFPPAGGMGLNTGIQDAHNLAWKIHAALKSSRRRQALLQSYAQERRQVALVNAQISMENYRRTLRVPKALGLVPELAASLEKVSSKLPLTLVNSLFSIGKSPLRLVRQSSSSFLGQLMITRARRVIEQRQALGLFFFPYEVGFSHHEAVKLTEQELDRAHDIDQLYLSKYQKVRTGRLVVRAQEMDAVVRTLEALRSTSAHAQETISVLVLIDEPASSSRIMNYGTSSMMEVEVMYTRSCFWESLAPGLHGFWLRPDDHVGRTWSQSTDRLDIVKGLMMDSQTTKLFSKSGQ